MATSVHTFVHTNGATMCEQTLTNIYGAGNLARRVTALSERVMLVSYLVGSYTAAGALFLVARRKKKGFDHVANMLRARPVDHASRPRWRTRSMADAA